MDLNELRKTIGFRDDWFNSYMNHDPKPLADAIRSGHDDTKLDRMRELIADIVEGNIRPEETLKQITRKERDSIIIKKICCYHDGAKIPIKVNGNKTSPDSCDFIAEEYSLDSDTVYKIWQKRGKLPREDANDYFFTGAPFDTRGRMVFLYNNDKPESFDNVKSTLKKIDELSDKDYENLWEIANKQILSEHEAEVRKKFEKKLKSFAHEKDLKLTDKIITEVSESLIAHFSHLSITGIFGNTSLISNELLEIIRKQI